MKTLVLALTLAVALVPITVHAAEGDSPSKQVELPWVQAEVKKVDTAGGRIILRHGDIPNLDMPAMTMAFRVADPKMLDAVKAGDAVRVSIDKSKGQLTILRMEPVK